MMKNRFPERFVLGTRLSVLFDLCSEAGHGSGTSGRFMVQLTGILRRICLSSG